MTSNHLFESCQLEKSHWKINYIVTTEYIILAQNQHSIFTSHYFNAKLLGKYSKFPVWQLCHSCQILDLINFQNNLTGPNSNTAGISLDSRLEYSKITHRYSKTTRHSLSSCTDTFPSIQISSILSVHSPVLWHKCQRVVNMGQLHLNKTCWELWLSNDQPHTMDSDRGHWA